MNILVCDDDREIVGAMEIYLKNEGYYVFKAYDGIEALDILRKEEIHPHLDGYYDAQAGRYAYYHEDPGRKEHSHYHAVG